VRSTRAPGPAILRLKEGVAEVELLVAEDGVSPGQACVFYESDDPRARVLGGGTIATRVGAPRLDEIGTRLPQNAGAA